MIHDRRTELILDKLKNNTELELFFKSMIEVLDSYTYIIHTEITSDSDSDLEDEPDEPTIS